MNRNEEWDAFIHEIKSSFPPELDFCAEQAMARAKRRSRAGLYAAIPAAGVCVAVVALAAVCNTSKGFANTAKHKPFLRGLARLLTANPSLRAITAGGTGNA